MTWLLTKYALTALIVVLVSEVARRSTVLGAVLASVPMVSVLAMIWIYMETKDTARIAALSTDIIWLVLPSLVLFIVLPLMLKHGVGFWASLASGIASTALAYVATLAALKWFKALT